MILSFFNYDKDDWNKHLIEFVVARNASVHSTAAYALFYLYYDVLPMIMSADIMVPTQ